MGFMDEVKAAADGLTKSVEGSLSSSNAGRDVERHYRDLGMLTYLAETGRVIDDADRARVMAGLKAAEETGAMPSFALVTSAAPPPPPPPPAAAAPPKPPPPPEEPAHRPETQHPAPPAPGSSDPHEHGSTPPGRLPLT